MLRQPQSPCPGAPGVDAGDPWLPRNQGAIRGEVSGKEKADLRDTMRLGGPHQQTVPKQATGFKSSAAPEPGLPVLHPCRWHRESSQCLCPLDTRSSGLTSLQDLPELMGYLGCYSLPLKTPLNSHSHPLVMLGMAPMTICLHRAEDTHALCWQSMV